MFKHFSMKELWSFFSSLNFILNIFLVHSVGRHLGFFFFFFHHHISFYSCRTYTHTMCVCAVCMRSVQTLYRHQSTAPYFTCIVYIYTHTFHSYSSKAISVCIPIYIYIYVKCVLKLRSKQIPYDVSWKLSTFFSSSQIPYDSNAAFVLHFNFSPLFIVFSRTFICPSLSKCTQFQPHKHKILLLQHLIQ